MFYGKDNKSENNLENTVKKNVKKTWMWRMFQWISMDFQADQKLV